MVDALNMLYRLFAPLFVVILIIVGVDLSSELIQSPQDKNTAAVIQGVGDIDAQSQVASVADKGIVLPGNTYGRLLGYQKNLIEDTKKYLDNLTEILEKDELFNMAIALSWDYEHLSYKYLYSNPVYPISVNLIAIGRSVVTTTEELDLQIIRYDKKNILYIIQVDTFIGRTIRPQLRENRTLSILIYALSLKSGEVHHNVRYNVSCNSVYGLAIIETEADIMGHIETRKVIKYDKEEDRLTMREGDISEEMNGFRFYCGNPKISSRDRISELTSGSVTGGNQLNQPLVEEGSNNPINPRVDTNRAPSQEFTDNWRTALTRCNNAGGSLTQEAPGKFKCLVTRNSTLRPRSRPEPIQESQSRSTLQDPIPSQEWGSPISPKDYVSDQEESSLPPRTDTQIYQPPQQRQWSHQPIIRVPQQNQQQKEEKSLLERLVGMLTMLSVLSVLTDGGSDTGDVNNKGGDLRQPEFPDIVAKPQCLAFKSNKTEIDKGEEIVLQWVVRGASNIVITPRVEIVEVSNSEGVRKKIAIARPESSVRYTLVATNTKGEEHACQSQEIIVRNPEPVISCHTTNISVDPDRIIRPVCDPNLEESECDNAWDGELVNISWDTTPSQCLSTCKISNQDGDIWTSLIDLERGENEGMLRETSIFKIECSDSLGNVTESEVEAVVDQE